MTETDPTHDLLLGVDALADALALWATRDATKAQPEVREAANTACEEIDGLVAKLQRMRAILVAEVREARDD